MDQELIPWSEAMKIPSQEWILAIFWQTMIYFWKGEMDNEFYRTHRFPHSVDDVLLRVDHRFRDTIRYHVFEIGDEATGILDESPFWIHYEGFQDLKQPSIPYRYLEHGDYRHVFQYYIRSIMKRIKRYCVIYPDINRLYRILQKLKILNWRCPVCRVFQSWNQQITENLLAEHHLHVSRSEIIFLLTHENVSLRTSELTEECGDMQELTTILTKCLTQFFEELEPICEGTSINNFLILQNLIEILNHHSKDRPLEDIIYYERDVCRDIKDYLYKQFRFIQSLSIANIPRNLLIARDVFATLVKEWHRLYQDDNRSFSPGLILLLQYLIFDDRAVNLKKKETMLVSYENNMNTRWIRAMTPPELDDFTTYHPLLRAFLFSSMHTPEL
jgi:hypothetical protein